MARPPCFTRQAPQNMGNWVQAWIAGDVRHLRLQNRIQAALCIVMWALQPVLSSSCRLTGTAFARALRRGRLSCPALYSAQVRCVLRLVTIPSGLPHTVMLCDDCVDRPPWQRLTWFVLARKAGGASSMPWWSARRCSTTASPSRTGCPASWPPSRWCAWWRDFLLCLLWRDSVALSAGLLGLAHLHQHLTRALCADAEMSLCLPWPQVLMNMVPRESLGSTQYYGDEDSHVRSSGTHYCSSHPVAAPLQSLWQEQADATMIDLLVWTRVQHVHQRGDPDVNLMCQPVARRQRRAAGCS